MKTATVTIINQAGLHARAASRLAGLCARYAADIHIRRADGSAASARDGRVDGKSILSLMMLAAVKGSELHIEADGPDETEALQAICDLIADRFGEAE